MSGSSVDYNDERFTQVEANKQNALMEADKMYGDMINQSDNFYQSQIDAVNRYAEEQKQLQQDQTDFAIEQIEQQKEQANKNYQKEQSAAYVDYQKQSNKYGAEAEQMATGGLANTGFGESSKVSMYNTYQNRVATARESYNNAVLNYDNAMKEAQLQNSSALAEIAYNALQQELQLGLEGFQYQNSLLLEQAAYKQQIDSTYYGRYQDVLNQINQEIALAEEIRQYNENMQFQKQQYDEEVRQYNESMQFQKQQYEEEIRRYNENLQLQKEQYAEEIRQFELNYQLDMKRYDESIRQFNAEMERLKKKDAEEYAYEIQLLEQQKKAAEQEKAQAQQEYKIQQEAYVKKQEELNNKTIFNPSTFIYEPAPVPQVVTPLSFRVDSTRGGNMHDDIKKQIENNMKNSVKEKTTKHLPVAFGSDRPIALQ